MEPGYDLIPNQSSKILFKGEDARKAGAFLSYISNPTTPLPIHAHTH